MSGPGSVATGPPSSRLALRFTTALVLSTLVGCEASKSLPAKDTDNAIGELMWAIGPERGQIGFSQVLCKDTAAGRQIRLVGTQVLQGADFSAKPDVLIAQFPPTPQTNALTPDFGASVFLPNLELDGRTYPMIQLVAQAMPGVPENVSCELGGGHRLILTCQHARVIPWLSPTPIPEGAFKVEFECSAL